MTGNITALAKSGIILKSHYVCVGAAAAQFSLRPRLTTPEPQFLLAPLNSLSALVSQPLNLSFYWCSPTRRSFLSGRLPVHHGQMLSQTNTDDLDLRWSLISQKLKAVGYRCFWMGKGHTGFKSWRHMPLQRGFDGFIGFLTGMQSYYSDQRWLDNAPFPNRGLSHNSSYSTTLYGEHTLGVLRNHSPSTPLFLYLPWQAVHSPHQAPPDWRGGQEQDADVYRGMLWAADGYIGKVGSLVPPVVFRCECRSRASCRLAGGSAADFRL